MRGWLQQAPAPERRGEPAFPGRCRVYGYEQGPHRSPKNHRQCCLFWMECGGVERQKEREREREREREGGGVVGSTSKTNLRNLHAPIILHSLCLNHCGGITSENKHAIMHVKHHASSIPILTLRWPQSAGSQLRPLHTVRLDLQRLSTTQTLCLFYQVPCDRRDDTFVIFGLALGLCMVRRGAAHFWHMMVSFEARVQSF